MVYSDRHNLGNFWYCNLTALSSYWEKKDNNKKVRYFWKKNTLKLCGKIQARTITLLQFNEDLLTNAREGNIIKTDI